MPRILSTEGLARFSTRRPWLVVSIWVVALFVAAASAATIGGVLTTEAESYRESESSRAETILQERFFGVQPAEEFVLVHSDTLTVDDPAFAEHAGTVIAALRQVPGIEVLSYFETGAPTLVSESRTTLLVPVVIASGEIESQAEEVIHAIEPLNSGAFTVVTGGEGSISVAFNETSEKDLQTAEVIGLPIALLILVVVFGALVAAGVPIVLGLMSIVIALGISALIGRTFELSIFVVNIITTIGLAVGIDYSLLVIQRVREERRNGLSRDEAIIKAGGTASRAVLFSGMAVVVALSGLLIVPQSIFRSMGVGAIVVVIVAVLAAMTLLPATLRLLGDRVNSVRVRMPWRRESSDGAFWDRTTRTVMRHPVASLVGSSALLIAATIPYATVELGFSGVSTLPESSSARQAFNLLDEEFSAGLIGPAQVVVESTALDSAPVQDGISRLVAAIEADPVFGEVTVTTNQAGDLALVETTIIGDPQGDTARAAVNRLRDTYVPSALGAANATTYVGGDTAAGMDDTELIADYTIPVMAFVLGLSFLILLMVFRSIVVPIKAIIMNLLSVGAAYGLMVLVFQHGVGANLLGFQQVERIESWVPLFMFAILFGLSMDYHVFLLTRIRERFDQTGDNAESVAFGVRTTAGLITGAALIMVAVFTGFAMGEMVMFQQFGFGLAVAVLLDATIVRSVLVPASMALLGNANWYLPSWLGWLPHINVEGSHEPHTAPVLQPDF